MRPNEDAFGLSLFPPVANNRTDLCVAGLALGRQVAEGMLAQALPTAQWNDSSAWCRALSMS